jgi:hypothetical protein
VANLLALIRCAAHTLQLAIKDLMSLEEIVNSAVNALAKKLRTPGVRIILRELKLTSPALGNATLVYLL